jgi:hypothetical protein
MRGGVGAGVDPSVLLHRARRMTPRGVKKRRKVGGKENKSSMYLPSGIDNLGRKVLILIADYFAEGILDSRIVALDEVAVDELYRQTGLAYMSSGQKSALLCVLRLVPDSRAARVRASSVWARGCKRTDGSAAYNGNLSLLGTRHLAVAGGVRSPTICAARCQSCLKAGKGLAGAVMRR